MLTLFKFGPVHLEIIGPEKTPRDSRQFFERRTIFGRHLSALNPLLNGLIAGCADCASCRCEAPQELNGFLDMRIPFHPPDSIQENLAIQEIPALSQVFYVPTMLAMSIHTRIRELRTRRGLTLQEFAKRVGVKSWQTCQQWEGTDEKATAPKRTRLELVAQVLETTPQYLLTGDGPIDDWPFTQLDKIKICNLSHDDLVRLETAVVAFADHFGFDVTRMKTSSVA